MSQKTEHGSSLSYFIGFVLSLVFTLIPYHLVVNEKFTGNKLLYTILVFAILQMLVQIFFFLHLGRGPKPLYNVVFFVSTVGIILVVVGGSMYIMRHLHYNMTPADTSKQLAEGEAIYQVNGQKTGACQTIKANHKIIVNKGSVNVIQTKAKLCDTLTFTSQDGKTYTISFNKVYAGETELTVRKNHNETITLNQIGTYQFYDNDHPGVIGYFTVSD